MPEDPYNTERLLAIRKLTRAVADVLRGQMKEYLSTLAPLLRPQIALGGYLVGTTKDPVRGADQAYKELEGLYDAVARSKPFDLTQELKPPLDLVSSALDMTVMEYSYTVDTQRQSKTVVVSKPLKWALTYTGFAPARLADILANRARDPNELQTFVIHYLVMHLVMARQAGVRAMLEALHFPITTDRSPLFGELPITCISCAVSTERLPDDVIVESTEVSGMDAFEEIVNVDDIAALRDPLKERLMEIVNANAEGGTSR
jgi:hypothetical protein